MANNQKIESVTWETEEFLQHPKNFLWYTVFALVSAGLIVFAIFSKSIITIAAISLAIIMFFIYSHKKPRLIKHQINSSGIILGDIVYPYKNITKFWIVYEPPTVKTLNLETTAYLNPSVTIQLGDQDPIPVKMLLRKYLPEDLDKEESLTDNIARRIRF